MNMNLKPEVHKLVDELYKERIFGPFTNETDKKMVTIKVILKLAGFKGIPYVLPLCLHKNKRISTFALHQIKGLLIFMNKKHYIMLDQLIRELYEYRFQGCFRNWALLKPESFQQSVVKQGYDGQLIGLISCHRNGYIREKAVQLLSMIQSGEEFTYFTLRLNDHIKAIRIMAIQELSKRITIENGHVVLENIYLLNHLKLYSREDLKSLYRKIDDVLNNPEIHELILEKLDSDDYYVRRVYIDYLLKQQNPTILKKALSHQDFVIRQKTSEYIVNHLELNDSFEFYHKLKSDSNMQVRRQAFYLLLKRPREEILVEIQDFLLDTHKSIREIARFYVEKLKLPIDVLNLYITYAENDKTCIAAISGIGDVGNRNQREIVKRFIIDQRPKVRLVALKTLSKIGNKEEKELFLKALQDPSRKVSKIATKALTDFNCEERYLFSILLNDNQIHVKRNIITLLDHFNKADSIKALLKALNYEREMRDFIEPKIFTWLRGYNRAFYLNFNMEEKKQLKELLYNVKNIIHLDILNEFELILK
jgi:hypothetical protein